MKIFGRSRGGDGKFFPGPAAFLLAAVFFVILFYAVFAYPFYTAMKIKEMKEAYRVFSEVNLAEISEGDEEDEEVLQSLEDSRFEILITDDEFHPVYTNRSETQVQQEHIIERYMAPYKDDFQEKPHIYIRKNKNFRSIRLRGLLVQGEDLETEAQEQGGTKRIYYVYIRLVVRSIGAAIHYTTQYLCAAAGLMFLLGYLLLRVRGLKLIFVPLRTYEKELYGAKYGGGQEPGGGGQLPGGQEPGGSRQLSAGQMPNVGGEAGGDAREALPEKYEKKEGGEQNRKAREEFVASVSHELKTPLAVISGQMEMLQSMGDRIDQDYYFTSIREEIDKMSKLVGNLLDLTIMEHQIEEMELGETDLSGMAEYMAQKYDALFRRNQITLETEIEEGCLVYGNRPYLEQAVNNYMMNAFQHTPQGKKIRLALSRENGSAKLCVYNEGSSIPPGELGRIWRGFYKESGSSRTNLREFRNAGLGLYFVKKIAEIHHGECGARNMDEGVEFWLTLPLLGSGEQTGGVCGK